jgi:hypothetical protein
MTASGRIATECFLSNAAIGIRDSIVSREANDRIDFQFRYLKIGHNAAPSAPQTNQQLGDASTVPKASNNAPVNCDASTPAVINADRPHEAMSAATAIAAISPKRDRLREMRTDSTTDFASSRFGNSCSVRVNQSATAES